MRAVVTYIDHMQFEAVSDENKVLMDAKSPIGKGEGMTPKELVAAGIAGCSGIDVVGLLKKYRQKLESLSIECEVEQTQGTYPVVFKKVELLFDLKGEIEKEKAIEAVQLSQTKFCGVSAMIVKTAPIYYTIKLNGEVIFSAEASF